MQSKVRLLIGNIDDYDISWIFYKKKVLFEPLKSSIAMYMKYFISFSLLSANFSDKDSTLKRVWKEYTWGKANNWKIACIETKIAKQEGK